jgi:hypothetical protein
LNAEGFCARVTSTFRIPSDPLPRSCWSRFRSSETRLPSVTSSGTLSGDSFPAREASSANSWSGFSHRIGVRLNSRRTAALSQEPASGLLLGAATTTGSIGERDPQLGISKGGMSCQAYAGERSSLHPATFQTGLRSASWSLKIAERAGVRRRSGPRPPSHGIFSQRRSGLKYSHC